MKSGVHSRVRRFVALPLVLFSFVISACDDDDTNRPDPVEWQAALAGIGDFEDVDGDAAALSTSASFDATIEITNAPADATFAWNVAAGTCAQPGAVVGTANSYPDLEVAANGTAEAEAEVTAGLNPASSYIVRVIDESGDTPVTVACGALSNGD